MFHGILWLNMGNTKPTQLRNYATTQPNHERSNIMKAYAIIRLFGMWHIAYYVDGVMQFSIYGGYRRKQDAMRVAHMKNIHIDEVRE